MEKVYVVYEQFPMMGYGVIKVYKKEEDAKAFCDYNNNVNKPEFDDYGLESGTYHGYLVMEIE